MCVWGEGGWGGDGGDGGGWDGWGGGACCHGSLVHCRVVMLNVRGGKQLQEAAGAAQTVQTVAGRVLFFLFCFEREGLKLTDPPANTRYRHGSRW